MSRELRICPGVGSRKCGAFLSTLDRDPHPTCTRCRGRVCTKDMTCDICADWSAAQWEQFVKKRSYKESKKLSRPSGSVPPAPLASSRARSLGLLPLLFPALQVGRGRGRGLGVHLVLCPGGLPPLPLEGWECLWTVVCCARARSRFSSSFGSWRSGCCSVAADFHCPLRFLGCLSPFLTAHSTTWGIERDFGGPLPHVILSWFPIFGSRSTEG